MDLERRQRTFFGADHLDVVAQTHQSSRQSLPGDFSGIKPLRARQRLGCPRLFFETLADG
jgi:hypothetical protein